MAGPRLVIAEVLRDVAEFCPSDTIVLSRALRCSVIGSETIEGLLGSREVGQDDVMLELAWPVFHAAMGAQTPVERKQVLEELCTLTEVEAEIATRRPGGLPNDGKRAANLVGRTLGGGPQFWSDFEDAASTLAARLLDRAATESVTSPLAAVLRALLVPAMALERQQIWSDDYTLHIQRYVVLPDHPAWQTREVILARVKHLLADVNVPFASRLILWPLLTEAHSSVIRCRGQVPASLQAQMRQQLLDDLVWARGILTTHTVELEELVAARDLWNWHYRFDKEPTLKAASEELEALYGSNALAHEFEPLLSHDEWEHRDERAAVKAVELAAGQSPEAIRAFIDRAVRFLGGEPEFSQLYSVAWHLGQHASTSEAVRNFLKSALAELVARIHTDFATIAAASWVAALRRHKSPTAAYDLIVELLQVCNSDEKRMHVIQQLYSGSLRPHDIGELTQAEHDHLRSLAPLFVKNGRGPAFIQVVGWTLSHDWPTLQALISRVLDDIPPEQMRLAVKLLVDAVYEAIRESDPATLPHELGVWLLDQLLRIPDLGSLANSVDWYIDEVLKRVGPAPLSWLPRAIARRKDMEAQGHSEKVRTVSRYARISRYVAPITATHVNNPEVGKTVVALVDLVAGGGTVGYYLPEIFRDVDRKAFSFQLK